MAVSNKYCEYFDVNETYFPCIDESAINAGVQWEATYPHDTFIEMLNSVDKMLGGGVEAIAQFAGKLQLLVVIEGVVVDEDRLLCAEVPQAETGHQQGGSAEDRAASQPDTAALLI